MEAGAWPTILYKNHGRVCIFDDRIIVVEYIFLSLLIIANWRMFYGISVMLILRVELFGRSVDWV